LCRTKSAGTALDALQDVEDQLTAAAILARQEALLRAASTAADRTAEASLNRYREGLIVFTDVVTVQATTALNASRSLLQAGIDRQTAAVALIQALTERGTMAPTPSCPRGRQPNDNPACCAHALLSGKRLSRPVPLFLRSVHDLLTGFLHIETGHLSCEWPLRC